jgi:hypothetical protein
MRLCLLFPGWGVVSPPSAGHVDAHIAAEVGIGLFAVVVGLTGVHMTVLALVVRLKIVLNISHRAPPNLIACHQSSAVFYMLSLNVDAKVTSQFGIGVVAVLVPATGVHMTGLALVIALDVVVNVFHDRTPFKVLCMFCFVRSKL